MLGRPPLDPLAVAVAPALAAPPAPTRLDVGVLGRERVSVAAPLSVSVVVAPAREVGGTRHWFKVGGINATPVSAQVVEVEPMGDRTDMDFVREAVRVDVALMGARRNENAVAVPVRRPGPLPAAIRVDADLIKEALSHGSGCRHV